MSENINNIPENEIETEKTEIIAGPNNYLDFVVEEDVMEPKTKKFSVTKLLAMIFGIISGLLLLYYAADSINAVRMQIDQYTQMGIQLPKANVMIAYFGVALIFMAAVAPIVGGLLPRKYAKCSILLLTIPVSYTLATAFPQVLLFIISKVPFSQALMGYVITASGIFALVAAILNIFAGRDCCTCNAEVDFYENEDDYLELDEETEELLEAADKEIEELLEADEAEEFEEVEEAEEVEETEDK